MGIKKMSRDGLGNRMKTFYEQIPKMKLMRRVPVVIRADGKSFHTYTHGFNKPFDDVLIKTMQETTKYLCENMQGCVLGYCQSDEISLVLVDYKKLDSSAWFDYEVQKMCSIVSSMTTMAFNRYFGQNVFEFGNFPPKNIGECDYRNLTGAYYKAKDKGAMFDARVFNVPREEVTNYFYWRQLDAMRNSIQMTGRANFSHKRLQNKSCNDIQDMLIKEKGIDWNNLPVYQKCGSCVIKEKYWVEKDTGKKSTEILNCTGNDGNSIERNRWIIDKDIPVFKNEGREYIERLINIEE